MPLFRTLLTATVAALAAAAFAYLPAGALAADPVASQPSFQWDGPGVGEQAGGALAAVGDVNGDGLADTAVASLLADPNGRADAGSVYVAFGRRSSDPRASNLPSGGIRIDGPLAGERIGAAVAGAGDVNGDGRADVLVTTREA